MIKLHSGHVNIPISKSRSVLMLLFFVGSEPEGNMKK